MTFDYLIVGAGLFGSVCARELTEAGKTVLVIDKNDYVGGACATTTQHGIVTQRHGGHIFHTNDKRLWDYVNQFAEWRPYGHHVKVNYQGRIYSFPINLMTIQQVNGITTPAEAERYLNDVRRTVVSERLSDHAISQVGRKLYEMFIEGYTRKQWGRDPSELPASIIKRIPVRTNWNDEYFDHAYQGLPVGGYTALFESLLLKIDVELRADYLRDREAYNRRAKRIIYTGPVDALFEDAFGPLAYRSLHFEFERLNVRDYQGCPAMNYTEADIPYTRILEFKHWYPADVSHTVIAREYPQDYRAGENEPYYPIGDIQNETRHRQYEKLVHNHMRLGGRLGRYRYWDMDQCIAAAHRLVRDEKII